MNQEPPPPPGPGTDRPSPGWPVAPPTDTWQPPAAPAPVAPLSPAAPLSPVAPLSPAPGAALPPAAPLSPLAPAAPEPPTGSRRPRRVTVAAVVATVLLLALVVHGVVVLAVRGQLGSETARLDRELAAHQDAQRKARDELQARFREADLRGKLETVRARDKAATAALLAWGDSGQPADGLKNIRLARNACEDAVIDYNATAARFPLDILNGLPSRINRSDDTTDCDR